MKIKMSLFYVILLLNVYSQEKISFDNLPNYINLLEEKRVGLIDKLPQQFEWETDKEYYIRKNEIIMNDKIVREQIENYIKFNYGFYKKIFLLNTDNALIVNSSFDREVKTWSIQFDLKNIVYPKLLSVYYPII